MARRETCGFVNAVYDGKSDGAAEFGNRICPMDAQQGSRWKGQGTMSREGRWSCLKPLILWVFALWVSACSGVPVRGTVGTQAIETRVDSETARYYVENYLTGIRDDTRLDSRIDRAYRSTNGNLPDRVELKRLSDEFSVDFAALYLTDRIAAVPRNRRFRGIFDAAYDYARKTSLKKLKLPAGFTHYEVLLVPIYLYQRLPGSGADLAAPRTALKTAGLPSYYVETDDDAAIEANADLVAAAIRDRSRSGRRLIILSASKSGSEVA